MPRVHPWRSGVMGVRGRVGGLQDSWGSSCSALVQLRKASRADRNALFMFHVSGRIISELKGTNSWKSCPCLNSPPGILVQLHKNIPLTVCTNINVPHVDTRTPWNGKRCCTSSGKSLSQLCTCGCSGFGTFFFVNKLWLNQTGQKATGNF